VSCKAVSTVVGKRTTGPRRVVAAAAAERAAVWCPGGPTAAHLDGTLPGDFGFDPLCLGADPEKLRWNREAELLHGRFAMAGVAGAVAQELVHPDVFFYEAATKADLPFPIAGLVAFQFLTMHWVEVRRWQDWKNPGSVDQDPIFGDQKLEKHEVGYPGGVFDPFEFAEPAELDRLKLAEIKHARLGMLAWVGIVVQAQATGINPVAALKIHLADPFNTTVFNAVLAQGGWFHFSGVGCAIPPTTEFQGITIPTPCLPIFGA